MRNVLKVLDVWSLVYGYTEKSNNGYLNYYIKCKKPEKKTRNAN